MRVTSQDHGGADGVGTVYLVGAGPGTAGLVTRHAKSVLAQADVIVYDRLLSPRILGFASPTANFVYVGKEVGRHTLSQKGINDLLVTFAEQGQTVVRLKGGDPFVFGRGGEEAEACKVAEVPVEVVPGVSSPVAVSAYAGIPVTQRGVATSFTVLTGHECATASVDDEAWKHLAKSNGTIVVLMGVGRLDTIASRLQELGRHAETPTALIQWGTRAAQQTITGTLKTIAELARARKVQPPAIIVIGEVVRYRGTLEWFERKPLMGKRILIAADTKEQGVQMADAVEALGVEALDICVEQGTILNLPKIQQLLATSDSAENRLVFLTIQAVQSFFKAFRLLGRDWRTLVKFRFEALNSEIAAALLSNGISADAVLDPEKGPPNEEIVRVSSDGSKGCWTVLCASFGESQVDFAEAADRGCDDRQKEIYLDVSHALVSTSQFSSICASSDGVFDFLWATSSEALRFVQEVYKKCTGIDVKTEETFVTTLATQSLLSEVNSSIKVASSVHELTNLLSAELQTGGPETGIALGATTLRPRVLPNGTRRSSSNSSNFLRERA